MEVRFYDGKKKVYVVVSNTVAGAIALVNSEGIDWTRYKIY